MIVLAEGSGIDANGWAIIIGAIFMGLVQVGQMVIAYFREKAKIERENLIADRVALVAEKQESTIKATVEVKEALKQTSEAHTDAMDTLGKKVNGLADKRVEEARQAAFADGVRSESEKSKGAGQ